MSEPRRLLDGEADEVEQVLLGSASGDAPSRESAQRMLLALGIGGAAAASTATAATAGAAGKIAGKGALAAAAAKAGAASAGAAGAATWPVVAKWVGIAAVAGAGTWGVAETVSEPEAIERPAVTAMAPVARQVATALEQAAPSVEAAEPGRVADDGAEGVAEEEAADEVEGGEGAAEAVSAPTAGAVAPTVMPSADAEPGLADEVQALDRAREAMQADDPDEALRAVDAYQRDFGSGALAPEAEVLRIEALVRQGQMARARALGQQFLARHPSSPHARRVQSLLSGRAAGGASPQ